MMAVALDAFYNTDYEQMRDWGTRALASAGALWRHQRRQCHPVNPAGNRDRFGRLSDQRIRPHPLATSRGKTPDDVLEPKSPEHG
jgi:hypothetical protein